MHVFGRNGFPFHADRWFYVAGSFWQCPPSARCTKQAMFCFQGLHTADVVLDPPGISGIRPWPPFTEPNRGFGCSNRGCTILRAGVGNANPWLLASMCCMWVWLVLGEALNVHPYSETNRPGISVVELVFGMCVPVNNSCSSVTCSRALYPRWQIGASSGMHDTVLTMYVWICDLVVSLPASLVWRFEWKTKRRTTVFLRSVFSGPNLHKYLENHRSCLQNGLGCCKPNMARGISDGSENPQSLQFLHENRGATQVSLLSNPDKCSPCLTRGPRPCLNRRLWFQRSAVFSPSHFVLVEHTWVIASDHFGECSKH